MARKVSMLAPGWWDYTTLEGSLLDDASRLTPEDMSKLSREGFRVAMYDSLEEFYCAEALEYIEAWRQSTPDMMSRPVGFTSSTWAGPGP